MDGYEESFDLGVVRLVVRSQTISYRHDNQEQCEEVDGMTNFGSGTDTLRRAERSSDAFVKDTQF